MPYAFHRKIFIATLCFVLALTGCKVGPNYKTPDTAAPDSWVSGTADPTAEIEQNWWKSFNDPVLDQLIAKALAGNWDLKIAEDRIAGARAARATALNDLLPVVNTETSAERQANRIAIGNFPGFNLAAPFNTFQTGFDASWELDLFGGKRRELESATAELKASEATRDDARVSLLAEVARTYIDIRQYQAQIDIVKDTGTADDHTAKIARERFKAGEAPGLDATQAQAEAKQAASQLPYYENLLLQSELNMDLLLGEKSGFTQALITTTQAIPLADKQLVLAAPAKVIASRPDIRVAERNLASATAEQGVAVAQFFPDISLSGFLGLLSADTTDFLRSGNKSWDIGGNVLWPILNYGKLSANLRASDAKQQEAMAQYQKAILSAFSDVERSTTAYTKEGVHRAALDDVAADDQHALDIAKARYKQGLSSFIDVLDAERTLYAAQAQATSSRAMESQNLIAVYKSLGGGWKDVKADTKPAEPAKEPAKAATPEKTATK